MFLDKKGHIGFVSESFKMFLLVSEVAQGDRDSCEERNSKDGCLYGQATRKSRKRSGFLRSTLKVY